MSDAESPESLPRHVRVEIAESICTIRFGRPKRKNALTTAMYSVVVSALRAPRSAAIRDTMQREGAVFLERLRPPEALEAFTAFFSRPRT